jgi:MOSC domain-containing protein YiiM
VQVEIVTLVSSPGHRYDGRPGTAVPEQAGDRREELVVRAGYGVVGDRYAGRPAHRDASVTLLAVESLEDLAAELGAPAFDPLLARRNVVLRGADVDALRGRTFTLGGVTLLGGRAANPCRWMDVVLAPGAHRGLRGRGGVRCRPLTDGVLRLGPTTLEVDPAG